MTATTTIREWPPLLSSPHFAAHEFAQPAGYGCAASSYPVDWADRWQVLTQLLERIRAIGQTPIEVISGYRTLEYDLARRAAGHCGVSANSQHHEGRAADIVVKGVRPGDVHQGILRLHEKDLLEELGGLGLYMGFVHVDVRPHAPGELARWVG